MEKIINTLQFYDEQPQRLFHGRGRLNAGLEFINIDWLCPVILITLYREQSDQWIERLVEQLVSVSPDTMKTIMLQRRYLKPASFETVHGEPAERFCVTEADLRYQLDFNAGIHSGLFLDMASARHWLRTRAAGKRVLNLFSYTCAFSVAAIAGDAQSVVNVDMSRASLSRGRENHRLNGHDMQRVAFYAHDIFKSWGKLRRAGPYDLVIIDPPSYQPGSFVSGKDYVRVLRQLELLVAAGGEVVACLNDPDNGTDFLLTLFAEHCPQMEYQSRLPNPPAFKDCDPERALKVLHFRRKHL